MGAELGTCTPKPVHKRTDPLPLCDGSVGECDASCAPEFRDDAGYGTAVFSGAVGFRPRSNQEVHLSRAAHGLRTSDALTKSSLLLGMCGGSAPLEEVGIDPGELPRQLLACCQELANAQLTIVEEGSAAPSEYRGPVSLLKTAYASTSAPGSTTVLLAALDNSSSRIHGKVLPMMAVLSAGGNCGLVVLRGHGGSDMVYASALLRPGEIPRLLSRGADGAHRPTEDQMSMAVIEQSSRVHCVSVRPGDVVVVGSPGVFESLSLDGVVKVCREILQAAPSRSSATMDDLASCLVFEAQAKAMPPWLSRKAVSDAAVIAAEIVDWAAARRDECEQQALGNQAQLAQLAGVASH